ncbi:MAG: hypothetical protein M9951_12115 [Burkholderiaceae bacterium]|nr:hypothetical protein [Burkholderiaceae bacterium]
MSNDALRRRPCGQALVEALVGMALLATLGMLVVLLGKYQSIAGSAIVASRSLAFGCAVMPGGCAGGAVPESLLHSIRDAQFGPGSDQPASATRALWHDRGGAPMLDRFNGLAARIDTPRFDAGQSLAGSQRLSGIPDPADIIAGLAGPGRFGLDIADGIRNAHVEVAVQPDRPTGRIDESLMGMALLPRANTAVLGDTWSAAGPYGGDDSVEARVDRGRRLAPAIEAGIVAGYAPARGLLLLADLLGLESGTDAFRPGEIDVDLVPSDRLAP